MGHYVLAAVFDKTSRPIDRKRAKNTIAKTGGLGPFTDINPDGIAAAHSKLLGVERVVVTWVTETHSGTWRKGKKS